MSYSAHIDFYQYALFFTDFDWESAFALDHAKTVSVAARRSMGDDLYHFLFSEVVGTRSGKEKRYKHMTEFESGAVIFHGGQKHATVQLAGKACAHLSASIEGGLSDLIARTCDTCSRIDIAVDFYNQQSVEEFTVGGNPSGFQRTKTGTTYYYGNRTSEKYVRIYRYNPPNPRADTIRIEVEYKKKAAKKMASSLLEDAAIKISGIVKREMRIKGMQHDMFDNEELRIKTSAGRTRKSSATLNWLGTQVKASIVRLITEREATPDEVWEALGIDDLYTMLEGLGMGEDDA